MTALLDVISAVSYNPQRVDNWMGCESVFFFPELWTGLMSCCSIISKMRKQ